MDVHSCWRIYFVVLSDLIPKYKMIQTDFKMVFKICFEIGFRQNNPKRKQKKRKEKGKLPHYFWREGPALLSLFRPQAPNPLPSAHFPSLGPTRSSLAQPRILSLSPSFSVYDDWAQPFSLTD